MHGRHLAQRVEPAQNVPARSEDLFVVVQAAPVVHLCVSLHEFLNAGGVVLQIPQCRYQIVQRVTCGNSKTQSTDSRNQIIPMKMGYEKIPPIAANEPEEPIERKPEGKKYEITVVFETNPRICPDAKMVRSKNKPPGFK